MKRFFLSCTSNQLLLGICFFTATACLAMESAKDEGQEVIAKANVASQEVVLKKLALMVGASSSMELKALSKIVHPTWDALDLAQKCFLLHNNHIAINGVLDAKIFNSLPKILRKLMCVRPLESDIPALYLKNPSRLQTGQDYLFDIQTVEAIFPPIAVDDVAELLLVNNLKPVSQGNVLTLEQEFFLYLKNYSLEKFLRLNSLWELLLFNQLPRDIRQLFATESFSFKRTPDALPKKITLNDEFELEDLVTFDPIRID